MASGNATCRGILAHRDYATVAVCPCRQDRRIDCPAGIGEYKNGERLLASNKRAKPCGTCVQPPTRTARRRAPSSRRSRAYGSKRRSRFARTSIPRTLAMTCTPAPAGIQFCRHSACSCCPARTALAHYSSSTRKGGGGEKRAAGADTGTGTASSDGAVVARPWRISPEGSGWARRS